MKLHQSVLIVLLCVLWSCGVDDDESCGDPYDWKHYFAFVNEENVDFFASAAESYSYDDVRYFTPQSAGIEEYSFEHMFTAGNRYIFGQYDWGLSMYYISFGNGDIDTLVAEWDPPLTTNVHSDFCKIERYRYFYNGQLVNEWDFVENPSLRIELYGRNSVEEMETIPSDPYIILLPKKPNPDELN